MAPAARDSGDAAGGGGAAWGSDRRRRGAGRPCCAASASARTFSSPWALAIARTSVADWPAIARRCSFHVATMISFCDSSRSAAAPAPPPMPAWLCAAKNCSLNGRTSRKKMSLRASVETLPRLMSRARA